MRIVKMRQSSQKLEDVMHKFLLVKASQHRSEETLRDYQSCLNRFVDSSQDSLEYTLLEEDVLHFFSAIPNTLPAYYNNRAIGRIKGSHTGKKSRSRGITIVYEFIVASDFDRAKEKAQHATQKQQGTA